MSTMTRFEGAVQDAPEELWLWQASHLVRTAADETLTRQALQFLRQRASMADDREAKMKLSLIYADGLPPWLPKDPKEAALWSKSIYDKQLSMAIHACSEEIQATDSLQQLILMAGITNGKATPQPLTNDKANPEPSPNLLYLVGLVFVHGMDGSTPETLPQQRQQGLDVLSRAALQGHHKQAAYELGRLYSDRYLHEHNKDSSTALQWFHTALDLGEQRALVDLAYGYYEGDNHDGKNDAQAFRFAKQGADINDRYCQYVLGHLYLKGRGTSQNAIEAVKWLQCSADQGFAEAIEELAAVYLRGYGNVAKDYAKAYAICKRGLEYSLPFCQMTLADMYRHGWGTVRDYQQAFNYYQLAATHADPSPYAQHCLGEMFLNGEGVPQDVAVAEQWFTMASQQGYDPSNFKLQSLAKSKLSLQDLEVGMAPHSLVSTNIPPSPSTPTTPLSPTKSNRWSMNFFFQKKNVD